MGFAPPDTTLLQRAKDFLDYRLFSLSGGVLTPGSILTGLAIIIVAAVLASALGRWLRHALAARGLPVGAQFAASKIIGYVVIVLGILVAANTMGLRLDALVATSAVVAVGIGFGLQNIAQNFISGVILLVEQPVRKGDFVKVRDALGVVDDIGLRATHIVTRDEVTIVVPNSELITESVINHSRPTANLRMRIGMGVAYGSDTALVKRTLLDVARATPEVLRSPPPDVRFEDFGESALQFALLVWIADPRDDLRIGSALRFAIDAAFRQANIAMPFPQREITIRNAAP